MANTKKTIKKPKTKTKAPEVTTMTVPQPLVQKKAGKKVIFVLAIAVLAAIGGAGYAYYRYQSTKSSQDPTSTSEQNSTKSKQIIEELGKILLLSEQSEPTVARIDDVDQLKNSNKEFYQFAEQGDYLILYPTRAIIYRSKNNQIVNFAPIIDDSTRLSKQ